MPSCAKACFAIVGRWPPTSAQASLFKFCSTVLVYGSGRDGVDTVIWLTKGILVMDIR